MPRRRKDPDQQNGAAEAGTDGAACDTAAEQPASGDETAAARAAETEGGEQQPPAGEQHQEDGPDPDPFAPSAKTLEVARKTMTGDLRDAALQWIRDLKKPYAQLDRYMQQCVIDSVEKQAEALVDRCVGILATDRRRAIRATLESVTVKDGIKAVISCGRDEQTLVDLGMAQGGAVVIASADSSAFSGARAPAKPDPEQPYMPGLAPAAEGAGNGEQQPETAAATHGRVDQVAAEAEEQADAETGAGAAE